MAGQSALLVALSTLDYGYRAGDEDAIHLGTARMISAIWPIAEEMPKLGVRHDGQHSAAQQAANRQLPREAQTFARDRAHAARSTN